MKKCSKLVVLVLVLSLSLGITAFAKQENFSKGTVKASAELNRSGKSGTAGTTMKSSHLYRVSTTVIAYDKKGNAMAGNSRTSRTAAYISVTPSKNPNSFRSTHSVRDDKSKICCSHKLNIN